MLNLVAEELPDPFYYVLDDISSVMHCETPNHSVFRYNFLIRLTPAHVINSLLFMSYVCDIGNLIIKSLIHIRNRNSMVIVIFSTFKLKKYVFEWPLKLRIVKFLKSIIQ